MNCPDLISIYSAALPLKEVLSPWRCYLRRRQRIPGPIQKFKNGELRRQSVFQRKVADFDQSITFQDALQADLEKLNISGNRPFISQPSFWESEGGGENPANGAPLLDRNNGYLEAKEDGNQDILKRAERYIDVCQS